MSTAPVQSQGSTQIEDSGAPGSPETIPTVAPTVSTSLWRTAMKQIDLVLEKFATFVLPVLSVAALVIVGFNWWTAPAHLSKKDIDRAVELHKAVDLNRDWQPLDFNAIKGIIPLEKAQTFR
ncbi:MAG: hypothetical protein KDB01_01435 [Planctomycetaceae bacterium]|nr:hypothetical protein [Planctomycetaceae bacterium]